MRRALVGAGVALGIVLAGSQVGQTSGPPQAPAPDTDVGRVAAAVRAEPTASAATTTASRPAASPGPRLDLAHPDANATRAER